jgi:phosphoribosylformylglycinamidine synthase
MPPVPVHPDAVRVLVITGFGLNCERETSAAFRLVGAEPAQVHLNDLLAGARCLAEFHILAFIGGFSFGDHLGAGTVFANRVKFRLRDQLESFIADGKLVIGICNGFQTLTRLGLVPALDHAYFTPQAALAHNDSGTFRDDWVHLRCDPASPCIFTRGLDRLRLPIRHGEGKFAADDATLDRLAAEHLAVMHYTDPEGRTGAGFPHNPNGALRDIAGICDPSGRVFGLMPHPEAFLSPYNDPEWPRRQHRGPLPAEGEGVAIFRNAVEYAAASHP